MNINVNLDKVRSFLRSHLSTLLLVIAVICLFLMWDKYKAEKQSQADKIAVRVWSDSLFNAKIEVWKDQYNAEHKRAENLALHAEEMKHYADSVAKLLKVKPSQVTSISKIGSKTTVDAPLKVDTVWYVTNEPKDSVTYSFSFNDAWTKVYGKIGGDNKIHIESVDTLKRTDYWKRKWLLGPKHYYSDLTNSNPHVSIEGYKGVELNPDKSKKWSIGPFIGVGYSFNNLQRPTILVGISIQRSLIKF